MPILLCSGTEIIHVVHPHISIYIYVQYTAVYKWYKVLKYNSTNKLQHAFDINRVNVSLWEGKNYVSHLTDYEFLIVNYNIYEKQVENGLFRIIELPLHGCQNTNYRDQNDDFEPFERNFESIMH